MISQNHSFSSSLLVVAVTFLTSASLFAPDKVSGQEIPTLGVSGVLGDVAIPPQTSEPYQVAEVPDAGNPCDDCYCDQRQALFGFDDDAYIQLGGWASFGYHDGPGNGLFNNQPNQFNAHQIWFSAEHAAERNPCQLDWGFRFDAVYGIDGADTQSFGNTAGTWDFQNGFDYGQNSWALPQAYLEFGMNDTSVKLGHFYTLIGYEVVTAPDNFFYSHAITMYNSEPFTHTGVLVEKSLGENLTAYAGYTLGWDTGFDQFNDGSSFLGGISTSLGEFTTLTFISTAGNFGARSAGQNAYSHSIVLDVALTDNLNYVFQSDLLRVAGTGEDNVGVNQYLIYDVCDNFALGARMEWWKADAVTGYAPFGSVVGPGSHTYNETTVGANITVAEKILVRPEARFDWSPALGYSETTFGFDVVIQPF